MLLNLLWQLGKLHPLYQKTSQKMTGDTLKKWELLLLSEKLWPNTGPKKKLSKSMKKTW
jgi:hypothetical protein